MCSDDIALATVLCRLSLHFDRLASEVAAVEAAICQLLDDRIAIDDQYIVQLQSLDGTRQSLEDLALLSHFIADQAEGEVPVQTTEQLRLAATKELLMPEPDTSDSPAAAAFVGKVDLF